MSIFKKNTGKLKEQYSRLLEDCKHLQSGTSKKAKFYFVQSTRNRVTYTRHDALKTMLNVFNIDYKEGNDAPRGGAAGTYIELTPKALSALRNLIMIRKNLK